jgi:hypothetical protein
MQCFEAGATQTLQFRFLDFRSLQIMVLWRIGASDVAEKERRGRRSIPGAAKPDYQHEARACYARRQDRPA